MALMTCLLKDRHGTYYFRRVIPAALRRFMSPPWTGKANFKRNLGTKKPAVAKVQASNAPHHAHGGPGTRSRDQSGVYAFKRLSSIRVVGDNAPLKGKRWSAVTSRLTRRAQNSFAGGRAPR